MARPDGRRGRTARRTPTAPIPSAAATAPVTGDDDPNSDITGAYRRAKVGSAQAGTALDAKTKKTAIIVAVVISLFTAVNLGGNVLLYNRSIDESVSRASAERLNGAAQEQARNALEEAGPANARLSAEGLFPITIPPPTQSPASDVISNSATVQVLADMPRASIIGEDYAALGQAVARFYQRHPTITQSGPAPLKVQQLGQQYLRVAAELSSRGQLPAPRGRR